MMYVSILNSYRQHLAQSTSTTAHPLTVRNPPSIQQASSSSASSPILSPPGKTFGRNNNGTSKLNEQ